MVEQWSSKPPVWVRFLLSLIVNFRLNTYKQIQTRPFLRKYAHTSRLIKFTFNKNLNSLNPRIRDKRINFSNFTFVRNTLLSKPTYSNTVHNYLSLFRIFINAKRDDLLLPHAIQSFESFQFTKPYSLNLHLLTSQLSNTFKKKSQKFYIKPDEIFSKKLNKPYNLNFDKTNTGLYVTLLSYLVNINTYNYKTKSKISLTKIDSKSLLRNSSFFSDMNSGGFGILHTIGNSKLSSKKNYNILTHIKTLVNIPSNPVISPSLLTSRNFKKLGVVFKNLAKNVFLKNNTFISNSRKLLKTFSIFRKVKTKTGNSDQIKSSFLKKDATFFKHENVSNRNFFSEKKLLLRKFKSSIFKSKLRGYTESDGNIYNLTPEVFKKNNTYDKKKLKYLSSINTPSFLKSYSLHTYLLLLAHPFVYKLLNNFTVKLDLQCLRTNFNTLTVPNFKKSNVKHSNLSPDTSFTKILNKQAFDFFSSYKFYQNIIP